MNRAIAGAGLTVIMACGAFGQAAAARPSFDVASIKAAAPPIYGKLMIRMGGDPGRIDYGNVSLKDIIRQAYDVHDYQISGPDWMNSIRFDIVAKVPDGAPEDQVPLMWQTLWRSASSCRSTANPKSCPCTHWWWVRTARK